MRSRVLHRDARQTPPVAVGGQGAYLVDRDGRRYLDGSSGAAVCSLGYGHPAVISAIHDQIDALAYAHAGFFTTDALEGLAADLVARAPPELDHDYPGAGGAEPSEAALRLARQYFVERGEPARRHIIARWQSQHGNTLGALATGGSLARCVRFAPLAFPVTHIAPCYAYRHAFDDETEEAYGQ